MKLPHRRHVLHLAACAAALPGGVAHRAGGSLSVPAGAYHRARLSRRSSRHPCAPDRSMADGAPLQPFVIENRPGADQIGVETVVRAPADGYTLLLIPQSVTTNATLYEKLSFNFIRDIVPIAMISSLPLVMEVIPRFRPKRSRNSSPTSNQTPHALT